MIIKKVIYYFKIFIVYLNIYIACIADIFNRVFRFAGHSDGTMMTEIVLINYSIFLLKRGK